MQTKFNDFKVKSADPDNPGLNYQMILHHLLQDRKQLQYLFRCGHMDLQIVLTKVRQCQSVFKGKSRTLGIDKKNIGTADGAQEAIGLLDIAINTVSAIRSKLGAYQNRLEHSISNLDVTQENMTDPYLVLRMLIWLRRWQNIPRRMYWLKLVLLCWHRQIKDHRILSYNNN